MIDLPKTLSEIDQLIANQVQEGLHLDYKHGAAIDKSNSKKDEIRKDVSAFANSDGGVLIYGIEERGFLPVTKTPVDHETYTREWLEQVIRSKISPIVSDVEVVQIPVSAATSIYVVKIPKSVRGPHQAPDHKYYKRFNSLSVSMEDYEINDVRNRRRTIPPLISIDVYVRRKLIVYITVTNVGDVTAEDVVFDLPNELLPWVDQENAKLFKSGIKYMPPKRTYSFRYGLVNALLHESSKYPASFDVTVSYRHPEIGQRISDAFHIDLMDYWGSSILEAENYEQGKEIRESINKLTGAVESLNRNISRLLRISGATGLNLSITTLKNLRHIEAGDDQLEKIDPRSHEYDVFMEVLGVDINTASQLSDFFARGNEAKGLRDVEGVTDDVIRKINKHFVLKGDGDV